MQCDDKRHYFALPNALSKAYQNTNVKFPFDKQGRDIILYISPLQCKKFWKLFDFGRTKVDIFLPTDILALLKGIRYNDETDTSVELTDMQSLCTTFPKYVIVVQSNQMEFPMSLYYALDFDNINLQHFTEYQAFKLLILVRQRSMQSNEFITQSIMLIHDWQSDNLKQQLKVHYYQRNSIGVSLSNNNCVVFESNSWGCLLRFSKHHNMTEILGHERLKSSRFEGLSWSVLGSLPYQDKCVTPDGNALYITKSPKNFAVDNIILLVIYPNSTLCPGTRSPEDLYEDVLPLVGMHTFESSEFYHGFRKTRKGTTI